MKKAYTCKRQGHVIVMEGHSKSLAYSVSRYMEVHCPHPSLCLHRPPITETLFPSEYLLAQDETDQGLYTCPDAYEERTIRRVFSDLLMGCMHLSNIGIAVWPLLDQDIYYYSSPEDGTTRCKMYVHDPKFHVLSPECLVCDEYYGLDSAGYSPSKCQCVYMKCREVIQSVLARYSEDLALKEDRCEGWNTDCPAANVMTGELSNSDSITDKLTRAMRCDRDWLKNVCEVLDVEDTRIGQEVESEGRDSAVPLTEVEENVVTYVVRNCSQESSDSQREICRRCIQSAVVLVRSSALSVFERVNSVADIYCMYTNGPESRRASNDHVQSVCSLLGGRFGAIIKRWNS